MIREYYGVRGVLTAVLSSGGTVLSVSPSLSGAIAASGFVNGVDSAYFSLLAGNFYEVVRVVGVNADQLTVVRAQVGTAAQAFPIGSEVVYEVTSVAIIAQIGVIATDVTITGDGIVEVQELAPRDYRINVPPLVMRGLRGIEIVGSWPEFDIAFTGDDSCCGPDSSTSSNGDAIVNIEALGLATAYVNGDTAVVEVVPPVFTAGAGISITGAWPNYTIAATSGSGTVSSVAAGPGIGITGSPTVNPTIYILNTGVVAGNYGGMNVNSRGQITAIPATFNPVSIVVADGALNVARLADAITLSVDTAAVGVPGVVELTDSAAPFDPLDTSTAMTPAAVQTALETLPLPLPTNANNYTPESTTDYDTPVSGASIALTLATGQSAIINADVTMVDGTTPLTPIAFGMGIFNGATLIKGNRKITQSQQSMTIVVAGPLSATIAVATTAPPVGSTVQGYSLTVTKY